MTPGRGTRDERGEYFSRVFRGIVEVSRDWKIDSTQRSENFHGWKLLIRFQGSCSGKKLSAKIEGEFVTLRYNPINIPLSRFDINLNVNSYKAETATRHGKRDTTYADGVFRLRP